MLKIGLTGGIGSGKSQVADWLAQAGAAIIDTDAIAHTVTGPQGVAMPLIRQAFGADVLRADGALDRAAMREYVFHNAAARAQLEAILHPLIHQAVREQAALAQRQAQTQTQTPYILFVVPLLAENKGRWVPHLDRICVVDCPPETQVARVQTRSGLTGEVIARIMAAQASRSARLALADDVIRNDGNVALADLYAQVRALHQKWRALSAQSPS